MVVPPNSRLRPAHFVRGKSRVCTTHDSNVALPDVFVHLGPCHVPKGGHGYGFVLRQKGRVSWRPTHFVRGGILVVYGPNARGPWHLSWSSASFRYGEPHTNEISAATSAQPLARRCAQQQSGHVQTLLKVSPRQRIYPFK